MRLALLVARRELTTLARSPLPAVAGVVAVLVVAQVALGSRDVLATGVASARVVLRATAVMLLLLAPAVAMRGFAEERQAGTLEGLVALPIPSMALVTGKWLATAAVVTGLVGLQAGYAVALVMLGDPDPAVLAVGYGAVWLVGVTASAVGVAASAWTRSSAAAWLAGAAVCIAPWLVDAVRVALPPPVASSVATVGLAHHLDPLLRGRVDLSAVVALLAVTGVALWVGRTALERERLS